MGEDRIMENVISNLEYLRRKLNHKTQKDAAEFLDIGEAQYSRIINGRQMPSLHFILRMREGLECSMDDILFTKINDAEPETDDTPIANFMRFDGLYQIYYFDSSSYKGREWLDNEDSLKSGLILIYKDPASEGGN